MAQKRLLCISCSRKLTVWGRTSSGRKRYGCNYCGKTRMYKNCRRDVFILFRLYILKGLTYQTISETSGLSVRTLENHFHKYLTLVPPRLPKFDQTDREETFLLIDGLWFKKWYAMMLYRQSRSLNILHISFAGKEWGGKIAEDLTFLKRSKYIFTGIISDGGKGILSAVGRVFPHVPHQICMAHMHRRIIAAMGRFPKDERIIILKRIADHIWRIESREALSWWVGKLDKWININWMFLLERRYDTEGHWWYIHKGVRKAVRILRHLPKTSFVFLRHPTMPRTTNEIEAQFGHLGKRWLCHRGLKTERWEDFMKWFVYFYNQNILSRNITKKD